MQDIFKTHPNASVRADAVHSVAYDFKPLLAAARRHEASKRDFLQPRCLSHVALSLAGRGRRFREPPLTADGRYNTQLHMPRLLHVLLHDIALHVRRNMSMQQRMLLHVLPHDVALHVRRNIIRNNATA